MNYKHITLTYSIEGLDPSILITDLKKEGYESLFSNMIVTYTDFLKRKNPFDNYKEIRIIDRDDIKPRDFVSLMEGVFEYTARTYRYSMIAQTDISFGDVFRYKDDNITYCLYDNSSLEEKNLWFACWTDNDIDLTEPLDHFVTIFLKIMGCEKNLDEILSSDTFEVTHNKIIEELNEYNLKEASFSEKKSTFEILSDNEIRNILIELNKKGNILISDYLENIKEKEEKERKRKIMNFLVGQGLLNKELIVICKETGQWWNVTIPSIEKLKEIEKLDLTCTTCGSKISDEKIDELFKISEIGKKLVSGSYWMVGKVVNELLKYNVKEKDVFVNITINGEEIDIILLYLGEIVVFELKDKEFGLGDAYKFHGKISRLNEKTPNRAIYPIVITTKSVASEAKKLLKEVTQRGEYKFIESLESINQVKTEVFNNIMQMVITLRINKTKSKFPGFLLSIV